MTEAALRQRIRRWLSLFIVGLVLSGLTAFPLVWEVDLLHRWARALPLPAELIAWIARVDEGLKNTSANYPFIAYGTDWLAFAHLTIAVAFIGPWRDPVRNRWVLDFGLIACAGIIPLALVAGAVRGIPWFWQLIDCSFGVLGAIPLWLCRRDVDALENTRGKLQQ